MQKKEVAEKELFDGKKIRVKKYGDVTVLKNPLDAEAELDKYDKARATKEICHVKFSSIDRKGNLYTYLQNGIRLNMPSKNIDGFAYDPTKKEVLAPYLCQVCDVIVTKVDREKHIVTVSMKDAMVFSKGKNPQKELVEAIEDGIENGVYVQVPARIMSISGRNSTTGEKDYSVAIINIGGLGIVGYVNRRDWSPCFTRTLKNVAVNGQIINVVVTGKKQWESGPVYECNRAATFDYDPWEGIEEKFPKNSTVRVKCIQREEKNFFATIEGAPEINVYCYYPDEATGIHVEVGKEYIGHVSKVKEKLLQVKILMAADEEA